MVEKRVIVISLIFLLGVSVLVSAFSFGNLFGTGKAVDDSSDVVWELEGTEGICLIQDEIDFSYSACMGYKSEGECNENSCYWLDDLEDFMEKEVHVEKGWNLLPGFFYPGQMSYSEDLTPYNVKSIQGLYPPTQEYYEFYPDSNPSLEDVFEEGKPNYRYYGSYQMEFSQMWVNFNKSGSLKYRAHLPMSPLGVDAPGTFNLEGNFYLQKSQVMVKGYNFVAITPDLYENFEEVKQDSFRLEDISGNCDIEKAFFFEAEDMNWVSLGDSEQIPYSKLYDSMVIKVRNDCILGKNNGQTVCVDEEGVPKYSETGVVTITDSEGIVLISQSDYCGDSVDDLDGEGDISFDASCGYYLNGTAVLLKSLPFSSEDLVCDEEGSCYDPRPDWSAGSYNCSWAGKTCVDGACV